MKTSNAYLVWLVIGLLASHPRGRAADIAPNITADDVKTFLHDHIDPERRRVGIVVGYIDEHGSWVAGYGKLDNGTEQEVDGNTVFEIGSTTKTFTALLLEEMVARGEMKLDDPVAKYLPDSVKMPTRNGKEITLLNLAAQDSGLPFNADNLSGDGWRERFATYDEEKLYAFLSKHTLVQDPGEQYRYSNLGMGLLGHVMARRAGQDFETLIVERICQPLGMDSTRITLTPELKVRLATGHDKSGQRAGNYEFQSLAGAGALRSTVNDLLKYVAANVGLTQSPLTPLMQDMQAIRHTHAPVPGMEGFFGNSAMPWIDAGVYQPPGTDLLGHAGGTGGYSAFIGFDKKKRRGVVVLFNQSEGFVPSMNIGWRILQYTPLNQDAIRFGAVRETTGVGLALEVDKESSAIRITEVFPHSPASQAGLTVGLLIQKIDDTSTAGKDVAACAALIRGPAGSKIRFELVDPARGETKTIEITRATYTIG